MVIVSIVMAEKVSCYQYKENYYFVLGDNRKNSLDSRYNGFVRSLIWKVQ